MAIESAARDSTQKDAINLEAAHLNQVLCLLPSEPKANQSSDKSDSEDLSGDEKQRNHNLEAGKSITAHIKISTMATELSK
jgi:hypothetical protein